MFELNVNQLILFMDDLDAKLAPNYVVVCAYDKYVRHDENLLIELQKLDRYDLFERFVGVYGKRLINYRLNVDLDARNAIEGVDGTWPIHELA